MKHKWTNKQNVSTNTHQFTGSVFISGSLLTNGGVTKEIHVSVGGNDTTGNGTYFSPYRTITKAFSVIGGSGDAIIIHPGTYTESPTLTGVSLNVTIQAATTSAAS